MPFTYTVDLENSEGTEILQLTITIRVKSIRYTSTLFKADLDASDDFIGDLVLTAYEESSTVNHKFTETEENYIIDIKIVTNNQIQLIDKSYDLAFFIDEDGVVLEEFMEKAHRRGHVNNSI